MFAAVLRSGRSAIGLHAETEAIPDMPSIDRYAETKAIPDMPSIDRYAETEAILTGFGFVKSVLRNHNLLKARIPPKSFGRDSMHKRR